MSDPVADELLTLCPACGYDLRGTEASRCSECGVSVDRAALAESGFPWAHRRSLGRVRAYARTVWAVVRDDRRLAGETARVQDLRDGRGFSWVTAGMLGLALLGAWAWLLLGTKGGITLVIEPMLMWQVGIPTGSMWWLDLAVPWSAGVTMVWMMPGCLVLLAFYLTGVQRAVFRVGGRPAAYRERVGTIALYAAAPLVMALLALVCWLLVPVMGRGGRISTWGAILLVAGCVMAMGAFAGTLWRVGQWARRARHGGVGTAVAASLELLGLWVLGVVLIVGAIPCCVGFLWIVVDSFR